ncbi:hypothetical protein DFO67_13213 [Modicisalibacter xianhensis]|uniref:Lipoprotein n=1 Tax=Modicisalibacter xianhensis TaxID=442341 RepID=A0A4R8F8H3_9GAMM|nr:hypothetical protein [Halomonas xianhensis]TDX21894.1 hypothetical protein DFO67_13213 [Halomonas xianhensis]
MLARFFSRKFVLAVLASGVACGALFTGHMSGTEWLSAQGMILGVYGAANVAQKKGA